MKWIMVGLLFAGVVVAKDKRPKEELYDFEKRSQSA